MKGEDGVISARVVFDGTNGSYVNSSTHLRDQERSPVAGDIKRFMREKARVGEPTFRLTAVIKEAHRHIPIHPSDWHMLQSQLEPEGEVFMNTVGTFGICSASYWWSRVSTAMGRLYQYIIARYASSWVLLLADDYHIEMGGWHFRPALLVFFLLCDVVCCPLSWSKTSGGLITNWVGFELLLKEHALGLSERRAAWFVSWDRKTANSKVVPSNSSGLSFRLSTPSAAPALVKVLVHSRLTCPSSCASSRVRLRGTGTRCALQKQGKSR